MVLCQDYITGHCNKQSRPDLTSSSSHIGKDGGREDEDDAMYCRFSHVVNAWKVPLCLNFLNGTSTCSKATPRFSKSSTPADIYDRFSHQRKNDTDNVCPFIHLKKSAGPVCKVFAKGQYCKDGPFKCQGRHLMACARSDCQDSECPYLHFTPNYRQPENSTSSYSSSSAAAVGGAAGDRKKRYWKREVRERIAGSDFIAVEDFNLSSSGASESEASSDDEDDEMSDGK